MAKAKVTAIQTTELCSYGCGLIGKFINKSKKIMCCESSNNCPNVINKISKSNKEKYASGQRIPVKGRSWNRGLTKETDERIAKGSIAISMALKNKPGRPHTKETKDKLSKIRKSFLEKNPDKIPYLLNHSSKISYPEQYFIDCFSNLNYNFQYPVFRYSLDFANIKTKKYFEVDGEQHYVDKRIVEHDIKRTLKLNELGWDGIRIRWSHFQKLNDIDKQNKVKEIIEFLMPHKL